MRSTTTDCPAASANPPTGAPIESARLAALERYRDLSSSTEVFDRIVRLAAHTFDAPFATVSMVDADRIQILADYGLDGEHAFPLESGLAGSAIQFDAPLVVTDARSDPQSAENSLVTGSLGIQFYAGAPIITSEGHRIGTVDVLDVRPGQASDIQVSLLIDLAAIAASFIEAGLASASAVRIERTMRDTAELERDMAQGDRDSARRDRGDARRDRDTAEKGRKSAERDRDLAESERDAIEEYATVLQRTLLPPTLPGIPGLDLAAHYHPASRRQVSGDFYDVFDLGDGRWAFFLGDVEGHGPPAAAMTSLVRYTLRSAALHHDDPTEVLVELNSVLVRDKNESRFCTVLFGTLEPSTDGNGFQVTIATGGHLPALLINPADGSVQEIRPTKGMLVGATASATFNACSLRLHPGQTLLLYTDGLSESRTSSQQFLGEDGVIDFVATHISPSADQLVTDIETLIPTLNPTDDIALLAFSCQ